MAAAGNDNARRGAHRKEKEKKIGTAMQLFEIKIFSMFAGKENRDYQEN